MTVKTKRIYEKYEDIDGYRVLIDRLWPRGISRVQSRVDLWLKEIAPSTELRKWFDHDPAKWTEFKKQYTDEISRSNAMETLLEVAMKKETVTLLFGSTDTEHNNAVVVKGLLEKRLDKR